MEKRLFIGLFLKPTDQTFLSKSVEDVVEKRIRVVPPESYHITLIPPFYTNKEKDLIAALHSIQFKSFKLNLNTISVGPDSKRPRLIWAAGNPNEHLTDLRTKLLAVVSAVETLNFKGMYDPLIPHVTLLRFFSSNSSINFQKQLDFNLIIDHFTLIESLQNGDGEHYSTRHHFYV